MNEHLRLAPIRTAAELDRVVSAARADGHRVLCPTHAAVCGDQIAGAVSIGGLPILNLWAHTQRGSPRNTLRFWEQVQLVAADRFAGQYGILCTHDSPLRVYLEQLGGQRVGNADIYLMQPKGF